jgi:DNA-damage-inducible protein J
VPSGKISAREQKSANRPLVPNAVTIEAMKAARRGELKTAGSIEELIVELRAED